MKKYRLRVNRAELELVCNYIDKNPDCYTETKDGGFRVYVNEHLRDKVRKFRSENRVADKPNNVQISETERKLREKFTDAEIKQLLNGTGITARKEQKRKISFDGERVKFLAIGDTHIGSIYTDYDHIKAAFREAEKEGCSFAVHTGDVVEGLSNRPDQVFQCSEYGYNAQKDKAIELLKLWKKPMYLISGNHDRWFIKSAGADICREIAKDVTNVDFIGHDQADLKINGVTIRLFHGEDGGSYATSYRVQKVIESYTGGEKPNVLFLGHTHKALYIFERNIHAVSTGALQKQSSWMRSKKLASHTGFWIIEMIVNDGEVKKFKPAWHSFYE